MTKIRVSPLGLIKIPHVANIHFLKHDNMEDFRIVSDFSGDIINIDGGKYGEEIEIQHTILSSLGQMEYIYKDGQIWMHVYEGLENYVETCKDTLIIIAGAQRLFDWIPEGIWQFIEASQRVNARCLERNICFHVILLW